MSDSRPADRPAPVATTKTPSGQVIEWIRRDDQLRGKEVAKPPPPPEDLPKLLEGEKNLQPELEMEGVERGPEGTVPFRVPTEDISGKEFRKLPPPRVAPESHAAAMETEAQAAEAKKMGIEPPAPDYTGHYYGNSGQNITNYGGQGVFSCFKPAVAKKSDFSLIQIGVSNSQQGYFQTVEAGWQVYPDIFGSDYTPHLFIYFTTNGYKSNGDYVGGYNTLQDGWVQYDSTYYPGMTFAPLSVVGGDQRVITIRYQLWENNWWLNVQGHWLGYYPAFLFAKIQTGSPFPTITKTLGEKADAIGYWGEVYDDQSKPTTDMGSGQFASKGWTKAAYMHNLQTQTTSGGNLAAYNGGGTWSSNVAWYTTDPHFTNSSNWKSYMYVGGPGAA